MGTFFIFPKLWRKIVMIPEKTERRHLRFLDLEKLKLLKNCWARAKTTSILNDKSIQAIFLSR